MADPAHQSGWYPDPWKQAELRWHDGTDWTGQVHAPATESMAAPGEAAPEPQATGAAAEELAPMRISPEAALLMATAGMPRTTGRESNRMATAALVTGLMGVPVLPSLLGGVALYRISEDSSLGGRGAAIVGIVLGVLNVLGLVLLMSFAGSDPLAPINGAQPTTGIAPFTSDAATSPGAG